MSTQKTLPAYTFKAVERATGAPLHQITFDVVRCDGKVVRRSLWPDAAEKEANLLNRYCAEGWSVARYHEERRNAKLA